MSKSCHPLLLFFALALSSCVDKIELPPPPDRPSSGMLVQGKFLMGDRGRATANVYELYTAPNELPRPIGGADVWLEDDLGHRINLNYYSHGDYAVEIAANDPSFPVVAGRQYRLAASLPNGQLFLSAWETLLSALPLSGLQMDSVRREIVNHIGELETVTYAQFKLNTSLKMPGGSAAARIRWEIDQSYRITDDFMRTCYTIRPLLADNILLFDGAVAGKDTLEGYELIETPIDYRFAEGYYFVLYQQNIGQNAHGYFSELNQLLAKKGTLFDPPAGEIRSNISSPSHPEMLTYGFFYVAAQDTARLYISPETAGNPRKYCPTPPSLSGEPGPPNACDDCLLESGDSRLEKPEWWEF